MQERVIENWLTNTNERNFQVPFCQALMDMGHKIVYISKHRPLEKGKDVFTIDSQGNYHAYQLKTGDFKQSDYRKHNGELFELVSIAFEDPEIDKSKPWSSYIVSNGYFDDHARELIDRFNETNTSQGRNLSKLNIIDNNRLLEMFVSAHGNFFPTATIENKDFRAFQDFLKLYLLEGNDFFPKEAFFNYLHNNIFQDITTPSNHKHAISSSVLIASYILQSFQDKKNHWAQFECWTVLGNYIIYYCDQNDLTEDFYSNTLGLIFDNIIDSLICLRDEIIERDNFLEGNQLGDGAELYKIRATICLGALASLENFLMNDDSKYQPQRAVKEKIITNIPYLFQWGEGAIPFFYHIIKFLNKSNELELSKTIFKEVINGVVGSNYKESEYGLSSPYYSPKDVLKFIFKNEGVDGFESDIVPKNFVGNSYSLEPLVCYAAINDYKDLIEPIWRRISYICCSEFICNHHRDYFLYNCDEGNNYSHLPNKTQSWSKLKEQSLCNSDIPELWVKHKYFLTFLILTYPYRFNTKLVKIIEN